MGIIRWLWNFLVDVYYYSLPWGSNLPLEARLYLLTGPGPVPHFGDGADPPDVSYWPTHHNPVLHFGEWTNLSQEPEPNLISLNVSGVQGLDNIQAIGISFRSNVDFRGKVKIDNVRVRVVPEPATLVLLGIGLGTFATMKRFHKKARRFWQ